MASTNRLRGSVTLDGENYLYFHYLLAKFKLPLNYEYRQLTSVVLTVLVVLSQ